MPEYMNDAGYESHMVGKWHIGSFNEPSMPQARGFDSYLGYLHGEENYWTHKVMPVHVTSASSHRCNTPMRIQHPLQTRPRKPLVDE